MINGISPNNTSNNNPYIGVQNINPYQNNNTENAKIPISSDKSAKTRGEVQCQTCAKRKYKDRSDDEGVSFQSPTNVNPSRSGIAVTGHEREHYNRENAKAERENKEIISNTITVHYAVCPECGRRYAAGGETRTVTKTKGDDNKDKEEKNNKKLSGVDFTL